MAKSLGKWATLTRVGWGVLTALAVAACGGEQSSDSADQAVGQRAQALSAEQERVLGFETPVADWSVNTGTRAASSTASQGTQALALTPSGWTEVTSRTLSSLGQVQTSLSFDLRVPAAPPWGEVRAILRLPSQGLYWSDLGGRALNTLPVGQYATVSFALPAAVQQALEATYSDLEIKLVVLAPASAQPYLLDHLVIAEAGGGSTPPAGTATPNEFVINGPSGTALDELMVFGSENVRLDDRVVLSQAGTIVQVAQAGTVRTAFGADTDAFANVRTNAGAFLRSRAHVRGDFIAGGLIDEQDGVQIDGTDLENTPSSFSPLTSWDIDFVDGSEPVVLEPDTQRPLAPGAYAQLDVRSRAVVTLSSGVYYFSSFNTEPQAQVILNNSAGTVQIYVKNSFRYLGKFVETGPQPGRVVVGYLGTSTAFLQAPFVGSMVAPNATIELQRPTSDQHKGSWFGKRVHFFSHQTVLHIPFDDSFLCSAGDSDNDGTNDCQDLCTFDPEKTEPGMCPCGVAETDTDLDGVADCVDPFPEDPGRSTPGQCDHSALNAACTDGICPGVQSCNADHTCGGDGSECEPEDNCRAVQHGARIYFVCTGPRTFEQARVRCDDQPGQALVRIETPAENAFLNGLLQAENLSTAWIGANDLGAELLWRWPTASTINGRQFWQGGVNGETVDTGYARWGSGQPGGGDAEDCAILSSSGATSSFWEDRSCSQTHAYICEKIGGITRLDPTPRPPVLVDQFFPGAEVPDEDNADCVNLDSVLVSETAAENAARLQRCRDCTTDACRDLECTGEDAEQLEACEACNALPECDGNENCACIQTNCVGAAAKPDPLGTCPAGSLSQEALCKLVTVDPSGTCSLSVDQVTFDVIVDDQCTGGSRCGRVFQCADMVPGGDSMIPVSCTTNADCAAGSSCQDLPSQNATVLPGAVPNRVCINPSLQSPCDGPQDPAQPGRCTGYCFGTMACGQPAPECIFDEAADCEELKICEPPMDAPVLDSGSDLTSTPFDAQEQFGNEEPVVEEYAEDDPCPGQRDGAGNCPNNQQHRWCFYDVDDSAFVDGRKTQPDEKSASRDGGGGLVSFDFDPELKLDYKLTPAAFTAGDFGLEARAALKASTGFSLGPASGSFTIVDAVASAVADRCRFNTMDTKLEIFGIDFLPELGIDAKIDTNEDPDGAGPEEPILDADECNDAIEEWTNAVDRAKKAMRDAQELLTQFKNLKEQGQTYAQSLCEDLLAEAPEDFKAATGGEPDCTTESAISVVNRFVNYYNATALELQQKLDGLTSGVLHVAQEVPIPDYSDGHTQTIFEAFFFIGPVPANLEVAAFVNYGVRGSLNFEAGADLLAIAKGARSQLAKVTGSAEPFANAGITLFVGVGFSIGFASFSAGIEGAVTLGEVSLPTYASAALILSPENDDREPPEDLALVATNKPVFPPTGNKQYKVLLDYGYGMSASVTNILAGRINARLRLKFLFFSKTWRATLLNFQGFSADPNPIPILTGGGEVDALGTLELPTALDDHSWATMQMPLPFLQLPTLSDFDLPSAPPGGPPVVTVDFDTANVAELFYDRLCVCQDDGETCQNAFDCCDQPPGVQPLVCFSDPEATVPATTVCTDCRADNESCNTDDDCCDIIGGQEGVCVQKDFQRCQACLPSTDQQTTITCEVSDECCDDLAQCNAGVLPGIFGQPDVPFSHCCRATDLACSGASDCCSGICEGGVCSDPEPPQ